MADFGWSRYEGQIEEVGLRENVREITSVSLHHGRGAENAALSSAEAYGRILACLGTEKGVRKDDSREMLRIHNAPPTSDGLSSVVIGPMDLATPEAADALLKVVEEPSPYTKPFLWAYDIGEVSPTIRSRCHAVWAYDTEEAPTADIEERLLDEAISGDEIAIAELLLKHSPKEVLEGVTNRAAEKGVPPRNWLLWKAALGQESVASVATALAARDSRS